MGGAVVGTVQSGCPAGSYQDSGTAAGCLPWCACWVCGGLTSGLHGL